MLWFESLGWERWKGLDWIWVCWGWGWVGWFGSDGLVGSDRMVWFRSEKCGIGRNKVGGMLGRFDFSPLLFRFPLQ